MHAWPSAMRGCLFFLLRSFAEWVRKWHTWGDLAQH